MPCWHIIVGGDFATQHEAKSWSRKLKKAGIHNYFKHAGRYLGPDPRIAAACAEQKNPSSSDGALYPALQLGGHVLVPVSAPAAILERAMEKAGPYRAIDDDKNAWKRALIPLRVGEISVGQTLHVAAPAPQQKSQDCKVKGFVSLTWGTPHFGWQQDAAQATKPGCGTAQVMAELNCNLGRENALSVAYAPGKTPRVFPLPPQRTPIQVLPDSTMDQDTDLRSAKARGQKLADEGDGILVTDITAYEIEDSDYVVQNYRLYTGEGQAFCGGDDFVETHSALVQKGVQLTSFIDTTLDDMKAIVQDGSNFYFLTFGSSGALLLRDGKGKTRGKIAKGFCDCGC